VEDLLRTLKSALEARLKVRIPASHPVTRWLVEHVATILNRYSVNKDGQTPYFAFHGRRPSDRLVEFGERVFYFVPKKIRSKLDHRWRLGIFIGLSSNSNESFVATLKGNVVKTRSVARVVEAHRWDSKAVLDIKGTPSSLTPIGPEDIDAAVEESDQPHIEGDAGERDRAEHSLPAEAQARARYESMEGIAGQRDHTYLKKITARDLRTYGYSDDCRRCADLMNNTVRPFKTHSEHCRPGCTWLGRTLAIRSMKMSATSLKDQVLDPSLTSPRLKVWN
jgi:hypothetical protein